MDTAITKASGGLVSWSIFLLEPTGTRTEDFTTRVGEGRKRGVFKKFWPIFWSNIYHYKHYFGWYFTLDPLFLYPGICG